MEFKADATLKAIAVKAGIENSPVSVAVVSIKEKTVTASAGETMKIALEASVPQENGYTGTKSNTKVTVTASITTASSVKKVVWKKNGSSIAKTLLADENANDATATEDNAVWTFDISATGESANGTYTVAAIDEAGREEAEQIAIDSFDFTAPGKVKVTSAVYSSELSSIIINWTEPSDADYDHVDITFTSNDGTSNSEASQAVSVNKGTANKTFGEIDGEKAYYTYTFVTYDELGNKGAEYTHKVSVNAGVSNVPEGFVEVAGGTVVGKTNTSNYAGVFIEGRTVTLSDFYMSKYEVTKAQYKAVMEGNDYNITADPSYSSLKPATYVIADGENDDNRPVEGVSWYDAVYFCNLLSQKEGLTPVYTIESVQVSTADITNAGESGTETKKITYISSATVTADHTKNGYRLPTEAEWEYAARGGANEDDWDYTFSGAAGVSGYTSSTNTGLDAVGWYWYNICNGGTTTTTSPSSGTAGYGTHEKGLKSANALGIYDMSGNVREWCYDWYGTVTTGDANDPTGSSSGSYRVARGGSWYSDAYDASVCYRYDYSPSYRDDGLGFRLVRSAQ